MASDLIRLYLLAGGSYEEREAKIAGALSSVLEKQLTNEKIAVILEGLPSGEPLLPENSDTIVCRIASGCFCCVGQLVLQVTLNRVLKQRPNHLYIAMIDSAHLPQLQSFLEQSTYFGKLGYETSYLL